MPRPGLSTTFLCPPVANSGHAEGKGFAFPVRMRNRGSGPAGDLSAGGGATARPESAAMVLDSLARIVKVQLPAYLRRLPLPESLSGFVRLTGTRAGGAGPGPGGRAGASPGAAGRAVRATGETAPAAEGPARPGPLSPPAHGGERLSPRPALGRGRTWKPAPSFGPRCRKDADKLERGQRKWLEGGARGC